MPGLCNTGKWSRCSSTSFRNSTRRLPMIGRPSPTSSDGSKPSRPCCKAALRQVEAASSDEGRASGSDQEPRQPVRLVGPAQSLAARLRLGRALGRLLVGRRELHGLATARAAAVQALPPGRAAASVAAPTTSDSGHRLTRQPPAYAVATGDPRLQAGFARGGGPTRTALLRCDARLACQAIGMPEGGNRVAICAPLRYKVAIDSESLSF